MVVNISATFAASENAPPPEASPSSPPLKDHLDSAPPPRPEVPQSLGSGVIIGTDGTILTNYHVVEKADTITVRLSDKRQFVGKVVGKDRRTDIAIVKIEAKNYLPTAVLGDSDRLEVGEWVMAIGNPFGLDNTVTSGIVSAKGRHLGAGPYDDFIQTDASVNPGNSGGPLVNTQGEVVGINMAIISQTGGSIGIGFATPVNMVKDLLPQLRASGKVTRGWLGVSIQEVPSALMQSLGWDKPQGVLVTGTAESGPAEKAGIRAGDIITEFDGREIQEAGSFPLVVSRTPIEKKVTIKIQRDRQTVALSAVIAELAEDAPAPAG
jgi:serine protease Do